MFQGLFLLILGVGLLVVDWRSLTSGRLPFGSGLGGRNTIDRASNAFGYWCVFVFYLAFGSWIVWLALGILSGHRPPLPIGSS